MSAPDGLPPELTAHPQYRVERELGRGGMGVVYLARNLAMDRPEVLKVLSPAHIGKPGTRDRFVREIRSAAKLHHPNVVTAYATLELGALLVLAMEYVDGEDLARVVKDRGPVSVRTACYYAKQAADGLQHAHEKGLVHRDVKPANLIVRRDGQRHTVKILDFGLAKAAFDEQSRTALTEQGRMLGTPAFMAPEQAFDAASADIRADVYSLGCTLYYLLTGRPPFDGADILEVVSAHRSRPVPSLTAVRPEVPAGLAELVAKMMAKDPADRYRTPAEVSAALAPFLRGPAAGSSLDVPADPFVFSAPVIAPAPTLLPTVTHQPSAPRTQVRSWVWPVAAAVTLAVAGGVVAWVATRPGDQPVAAVGGPMEPSPAPMPKPPADGWVPLFNGKNLVGLKETGPMLGGASWTVRSNGILDGKGGDRDFECHAMLWTERADYQSVRVRIRYEMEGWCYLVLRSTAWDFLPKPLPQARVPHMNGYTVSLGGFLDGDAGKPQPPGRIIVGHIGRGNRIGDIVGLPGARPQGWNTIEVEVEGHDIKVWFNKRLVKEFTDTAKDFRAGRIGLFCQSKGWIEVKEFAVKELPAR